MAVNNDTDFVNKLRKVTEGKLVDINYSLQDPILTTAVDALLPMKGPIKSAKHNIDHLLVFDIEFDVLHDTAQKDMREYNLAPDPYNNTKSYLIREFALLVLTRDWIDARRTKWSWTITEKLFFNTDRAYLFDTIEKLKTATGINLSLGLISTDFMSVSDGTKAKNIENEYVNIDTISQSRNTAYKKAYLETAYEGAFPDPDRQAHLYAQLMDFYNRNPDVAARQISAANLYNLLTLLDESRDNICYLYKGGNDIDAINNTLKFYKFAVGGTHIAGFGYENVRFKNYYDIKFFNSVSHILYSGAKLKTTFEGLIHSKLYLQNLAMREGFADFNRLVRETESGIAHDPLVDAAYTLVCAIIINAGIYTVFNDAYPKRSKFLKSIAGGGDTNDCNDYKQKYLKYKAKYLSLCKQYIP